MAFCFFLPSGETVLLDDADQGLLEGRNWYRAKRGPCIYAEWRMKGHPDVRGFLHSLVAGRRVDHKNGNGLDCRRENLRPATQAQNGLNKAPKAGKRFKGVCRSRGKFYAEIYIDRQRYASYGHLTEESAAHAYDALALEHHGEWARLNFPV